MINTNKKQANEYITGPLDASECISRKTLRDQVKHILLERIIAGEYKPGDRLVEMRIAQELRTSQAPVREALRELEALGFIESEPYRGAKVRAVSEDELAEICPVRAALEEVAARAAAVRLGGRVDALQAEVEAMCRAASAGDVRAHVKHNVRFHRLIVEASGNRILIEIWNSLWIEQRTIITMPKTNIDLHNTAERHQPIIDALAAQDADKAGRLSREHAEYGNLKYVRIN
jgi:DNA-binding GntR family transcriptional regulator